MVAGGGEIEDRVKSMSKCRRCVEWCLSGR